MMNGGTYARLDYNQRDGGCRKMKVADCSGAMLFLLRCYAIRPHVVSSSGTIPVEIAAPSVTK